MEVDPLEKAMEAAVGQAKGSKRRRVSKKKAPDSDSNTDKDPDEDPSSDTDGIEVVEPQAVAPKSQDKARSFFHKSCGIKFVDTVHPGQAKCQKCSQKVLKSEARLVWVHNVKKPHGYIHARCAHKMDDADATIAYELLSQTVVGDGANVGVRSDIAAAVDLLLKRLSQAFKNTHAKRRVATGSFVFVDKLQVC